MRWYRKFVHKYIILVIVGSIILLGAVSLPWYFNQSRYLITKVLYTTKSLALYDDPALYTTISSFYKKQTSVSLRRFGSRTLQKQILATMPYISSLKIKNISTNTITIDLIFKEPSLIVIVSDKKFALYPNLGLPLYSGNALGSKSPQFFLPSYLSGLQNLSGLLYIHSLDKITQDITLLSRLPLSGMITYLPGGEKYIYRNERRHIYFNTKKSLTGQIAYLQNLINNYPGFNLLTRIDLGSNDLITVK